MISIIKKKNLLFILLISNIISFAANEKSIPDNEFHLIEINSDHNTDTEDKRKKNKRQQSVKSHNFYYDENKDIIEKNIIKFNDIIYKGKDFLNNMPYNTADTPWKKCILYNSIFAIISIAGGVAVAISICPSILNIKEEIVVELQNDLVNNLVTFNVYNLNKVYKFYFNNSNNFTLQKEFIYLLTGTSVLFSSAIYKIIYYCSNIYSLKQYRDFINTRSLLSKISKLTLTSVISSLYIYGFSTQINDNLQRLNNLTLGNPLDSKSERVKIISYLLCCSSTFVMSFAVSIPVINLFVDTISDGINTIAGKEIKFNDKSMHRYLHALLDTDEFPNLRKKFFKNLLYNNFNDDDDDEDALDIEKTLQLMSLNMSNNINLSGIINNFTKINFKTTKYHVDDTTTDRTKFIIGTTKLAVLVSTLFILAKVGNNLYNDLIVIDFLNSKGSLVYLDALNKFEDISALLNSSIVLNKSIFNSYIYKELTTDTNEVLTNKNDYLGLATQLAVYSSAGILHILLDTIECFYVIVKHKTKHYRGPLAFASSGTSVIIPALICVSMFAYFDANIEYIQKSEDIQQYIDIDTSVLGINDVTTKVNIVKSAITFAILGSYKLFIPFTTSAVLGIKNIFNYFRKNNSESYDVGE